MTQRTMKSAAGFSLIELMVVVAIIGILASIAIPNFQRFQRKARQSEAKTQLTGLYTAEKAFHAEWNIYYGSFNEVGYTPEGDMRYNVGFTNVGGPANLQTAIGYPRAPSTANFNSGAYCAANGSECSNLAFVGTINSGTANVSTVVTGPGNTASFTAEAIGDIGGAADDDWTIDQTKNLSNLTDGTQ